MSLSFEWDSTKATTNLRKHRVSFEEASTVFADALSLTIHDPDHSRDEDRLIIMGSSGNSRLLTVIFTERKDKIRIISARLATRRERKNYEEGN